MRRVIVHIDLNAFFVRAEEIKNPSLEGKPVAIGHIGRGGIVSTCSYKARSFGVTSGMPMFKAMELCPSLIVISGDYHYYNALSHEFFTLVRKYAGEIEMASIDECFADFTEQTKNVKDVISYFRNLQNDLYIKTKLRCSIGVGPTKFLAKMGSDYKKPMGLTIIRKKDIKNILYPLPISSMFGIGKKSSPKLEAKGIKTIGDLADIVFSKQDLGKELLGKFFYTVKEWLSGDGDDKIATKRQEAKSLGVSTTLQENTNNFNMIKETLKNLCAEVSYKVKKDGMVGSTIQIVVKEENFKIHNKSMALISPTNDKYEIYRIAVKLYEENFKDLIIRLVGVTLQNLSKKDNLMVQMSLFDDIAPAPEENVTKKLINEINKKMDKEVLKRASDFKRNNK